MNALKNLVDEVFAYAPIEFDRHAENLQDAAFDVTTTESALMGIAYQFLSDVMPSPDQLGVLDMTLMEGDVWLLFDGGKRDLRDDEVLLRHAQMLVSLQQECRAYLKTH